ncbi:MAG: class I SAM-dependent methyltransferase, partial [Desulfuromonadales bacterium]|nr:class I SAM-dependent methyltransferase [Desulfuromonadales bacterium]
AQALNKRVGYEAGMIEDMNRLSEADLALGHKRLFTVDSLVELLSGNGYVVERVEGIFLKPITTGQFKRLNLSEDILQGFMRVGIDYPELCVGLFVEARL